MLVELDDTIIISLTPDEASLLQQVLSYVGPEASVDLLDFTRDLMAQLDEQHRMPW